MISANSALLEAFSNPTVAYEQKGKVLSELISPHQGEADDREFSSHTLKESKTGRAAAGECQVGPGIGRARGSRQRSDKVGAAGI